MQAFSREAAATFARHEIQQKRIERIKAVRNKEKQLAKQQRVQYVELRQLTKQQIQNEMEKKWETNKENELHKLTNHYNNLQSSIGIGHDLAHKNIDNLNKTAIINQKKLNKQNIINKQRARTAISKLQQKILNEQNEKEIRAQWRNKAIKMAQIHRNKLQKQLKHQYFRLPPGLAPRNPSNNNKNSQYTLVTEDNCAFNPHPNLYIKEIESYKTKTYNLREYLPSKLLHKLNKKYNKKRKKHQRRKKKEEKFKAAGIRLASDGNAMLSIPENNTCFHSIPSQIHKQQLQLQQQQIHEIIQNNNNNPWDEANKIRKQTTEKEIKQTQQFIIAQKRGKIALQKEINKQKSKQLHNELELLHQQMIQEKLQKCQQILDNASINNCANKLQAELEENFEDLFQIHSNTKNNNNDEEINPRTHAPQPQSFSSSSSTSLAAQASVSHNQARTCHTQSRKSLQSVVIPSVPIPSVICMPPQISNDEKEQEQETEYEEEEEEEEEESSFSVTKSRRIKIHKNDFGSISMSESTSMSTSPQKTHEEKEEINDKVIVPKKWFESLLVQIGSEENSENESEIHTNITHHGSDQIAMDRTWFEQLLHGIYTKKQVQDTNLRKSIKIETDEKEEKEISALSRKTATNSPSKSMDVNESEANEDEYNLIFKRQKPISLLSELLSEEDNAADDADDEDEYDPNQKPNNLRNSIDSMDAALDLSQCSSTTSNINIQQTSKFIRESAALLNQTANFFENFSESSMDYTKTDKSIKMNKQDIDKLLRSSIQSDSSHSSEWSLSSLSSIEFSKLPDSLHKLDQFLSNNQKTKQQTMQTIQEINERNDDTVSSFTIQSNSSWRDKPNTPKLFATYNNNTSLDYHSEEEKASIMSSEKLQENPSNKKINDSSTLSKQHFITPTTTKTNTNTGTNTGTKTTETFTTPRVTDGTINSYPSLPPSNKTNDNNNNNINNNESLLPIQHLNFGDIHVSDNERKDNNNNNDDDVLSTPSLNELKNFNQEMDQTLKQILKMKISADDINEEDHSFLSMKNNDNNNDSNTILSTINVSQIEPSNSTDTNHRQNSSDSYHSIADVMAKLSNLSTSSFSLSTFHDESQQSGNTNENLLLSKNIHSDSTIMSNGNKKFFPPLTPQDLHGSDIDNINNNHVDMDLESGEHILNSHNSLDDGKYVDSLQVFSSATGNMASFNDTNSILRIGDLDIVQEEPDELDTEEELERQNHSKTYQQIEIRKKLEKLKSREKQKRCQQISRNRKC